MGNNQDQEQLINENIRKGFIQSVGDKNFDPKVIKNVLLLLGIKLTEDQVVLAIELTKIQEEKGEVRKVFNMFDEDKNGMIDVEELRKGYANLNKKFTDKQVLTLMQRLDLDQNGTLEYDEFLCVMIIGNAKLVSQGSVEQMINMNIRTNIKDAVGEDGDIDPKKFHTVVLQLGQMKTLAQVETAIANHKKLEGEFKKLFAMFDVDNDGSVTKDELRKGYQKLGKYMEKKELERIMNRMDIDQDGNLDYMEFNILMLLGTVALTF